MNQSDGPELPHGAAWRMTAEFSRFSGFAPHQLQTLTNVPLPETALTRAASLAIGTNQLEIRWEPRQEKDGPLHFWAEVKPPQGFFKRGSPMSDYRLRWCVSRAILGATYPL